MYLLIDINNKPLQQDEGESGPVAPPDTGLSH